MKAQAEIITFARETLGLPVETSAALSPLAGRGSDRAYFRFRWNAKNSVIVAHYRPNRTENVYFADIAGFLLDNGIAVPRIIRHDAAQCLIVMQDLGDVDLWSLQNESWEIRRGLYEKTLAIAHRLHCWNQKLFPSARIRLMEPFGPDLYRWERNYFLDNFVRGFCQIELESGLAQQLEAELAGLAQALTPGSPDLVHRDLQSQNVMICDGAPFLIDFQGMRFGTRFYDLGSLLWDPYVAFSASERNELLSFYFGLSKPDSDWNRFREAFYKASAQRLMQALGAYGYLGLQRGLGNYLKHVPAGLRNLCAAAERSASLPRLLQVSAKCEQALSTIFPNGKSESQISNPSRP